MRPSQILRKLAAYPRQNELAAALREVGRIERSLFMIDWTTDPGLRRRVQVGLNKGEAHHALKRAINFHQRGELRDRTGEGQHYRVAGLNLLDQPDGRIALATRRLHGRRETLKTVIDIRLPSASRRSPFSAASGARHTAR